ncbi:MAG: hypothetical protein IKR57_06595 [Bacilli bacterium]|nr:hypothetical protein [Bacilli bacterium]
MNPNQNNVNGGQVNNQGIPNPQTPQPQVAPTPQVVPQPQVAPQPVVNNVPGPQNVVPNGMTEQQVVNNEETKKSNPFIVIVLIVALILFIFNMEKVEEYYNKYILKKTPQETTRPISVETNELIKIGETTSYNKVSNIKFYNFKKGDETNLLFTYEALEKINTPETLGIFIEIYNADKVLIYKEEFLSKEIIEKDTAKTYNLSLKNDIYDYYENSYYVLVKTYKTEEKNLTSSITCKKSTTLNTSILDEEIKYKFRNNNLIGYDVTKEVKYPEDVEPIADRNTNKLLNEYNNVSKYIRSASYNNNKLLYSVDLEYSVEGFEPLYSKGIIDNVIKLKETEKEWNCE